MSEENPTQENPYLIDKERLQLSDNGQDQVFFNFVSGGCKVEIHGNSENTYKIEFYDNHTNELIESYHNVPSGEFRKTTIEYYMPWHIIVKNEHDDEVIKDYVFDLNDKNVFISFQSSALGDHIAWIPYIEEFRKKHNCHIVCSTFHNYLFENIYPNIQFIERGKPLSGMHMAFQVGWFSTGHANEKNPNDCHLIPLQKVATDILGLEYEEKRVQLEKDKRPKKLKKKYVVITTCSTAQFKYWNRDGAWQEIVDYLKKQKYEVVNIGKQPNFLKNVIDFTGKRDMQDIINIIQYSDFFIGLPSGLNWLAWALGKKTIMITGITEPYCEYREDNYRVENFNVCHGCFNDPDHVFQKHDWMFCPKLKNTPRQFECTKEITPKMVKQKIEKLKNDLKYKKRYYTMTDEECYNYLEEKGLNNRGYH